MTKVQLIIPMSGKGQRFIDAGFREPKPLIKVGEHTILQHVIDMFQHVDEILFIVNEEHFHDEDLELALRIKKMVKNTPFQISVIPSHKLGPGWAIWQSREYIRQDFISIVNYCDFTCTWDSESFIKVLRSGIDGLIATYTGFHPHMLRNNKYAYVTKNEEGFVTGIQEKNSYTEFPMNEEASSGTYGFKTGEVLLNSIADQISCNDNFNNEFYISLTYKNMISSNLKIQTFLIDHFLQWGTPEDFLEFQGWLDFFKNEFSDTRHRISGVDHVKLLAAGEGRRFQEAGYELPKPLLPIGDGLLIENSFKALGVNTAEVEFLIRENVATNNAFLKYCSTSDIKVNILSQLSRGQAETALFSIGSNSKGNCIFATCDSLLYPEKVDFSTFKGKQIGAWVIPPSNFAKMNPTHFGWVKLDSEQNIVSIRVKVAPEEFKDWYVICGTFVVGDLLETYKLLLEFLNSGEKVNGEYYLDTFLRFASKNNWNALGIVPENFISLGTPNEYETFSYWRKYFLNNLDKFI